MSNLIEVQDLKADEIYRIWEIAARRQFDIYDGDVAFSFEGDGIRTRTTFLQAISKLGFSYIELPRLLKSKERIVDLAGYLDPFYELYVIREGDHNRLCDFSLASTRPVINAMSNREHPCEVLSDGFFIHSTIKPIDEVKVLLWGPITNVLRSWLSLAEILGLKIFHYAPGKGFAESSAVAQTDIADLSVDVVITDGWPDGFGDHRFSLTLRQIEQLGRPHLLPCPPFTVGEELAFDPRTYAGFTGYEQKRVLTPVQMAIIQHMLEQM